MFSILCGFEAFSLEKSPWNTSPNPEDTVVWGDHMTTLVFTAKLSSYMKNTHTHTHFDYFGAGAMHPNFVSWWCTLGILGTLGVYINPHNLGISWIFWDIRCRHNTIFSMWNCTANVGAMLCCIHSRMIVRNDLGQTLAEMVVSLLDKPLPMKFAVFFLVKK